MPTSEFPFRFHPVFAAVVRPFGVTDEASFVRVADDRLLVRFGPWKVETSRSNVRGASVTGPYAWPKVLGPARRSMADRGLTFASNPDAGVCLEFIEPVTGAEPTGRVRHPSLTVTVDDPAALVEAIGPT